jgi:hypothetical protein
MDKKMKPGWDGAITQSGSVFGWIHEGASG